MNKARTITKNMYDRLKLQADEAEHLGMTKTANSIKSVLKEDYNNAVRANTEFYSYSSDELTKDIEQKLWDAAIRASDFFGTTFDAKNINPVIERLASELVHEVMNDINVKDGVGAYEPSIPGEERQHVALEVDDLDG